VPANILPEQYQDEMADAALVWAGEKPAEAPKTRSVTVTNPDGSKTEQIVPDTPGQTFTSAPPVKEPKRTRITVRGPNGRPVSKLFTDEELAAGVEEYREPKSESAAKFWVMRNGQPVRVSESEYRLGDAPASTREQGRPVTSGDANRIATFQTSLDDLNVLRKTIVPDAVGDDATTTATTGTLAQVQAGIPNWATQLLGGWGTEAKGRQAVIDRVKQVIGAGGWRS
jgi:hypothetical protein